MSECLFCRIVKGEIKADILAENSEAVAFRDINPAAPVHFLVVPKEHVKSLEEIEGGVSGAGSAILNLASETAEKEGIDRSGYRVIINIGEDAGQEIDHVHLHVLGGRAMTWPPG